MRIMLGFPKLGHKYSSFNDIHNFKNYITMIFIENITLQLLPTRVLIIQLLSL